jgi:FdhE protein
MESGIPDTDIVSSLDLQIQRVEERKPSLKDVVEPFKGIMIAGAELRSELAAFPPASIAPPDPTRLSAGVPLLFDTEFQEMVPNLTAGVKRMLTALGKAFPPLKEDAAKLIDRADQNPSAPAAWLKMLIQNEQKVLGDLAKESELETETVRFILEQSLKPYFQWLAQKLNRHVEGTVWDQGYCPICGAYPDTSYLKKGDTEQEFLMAHGGQRWLHCAMCSHEWRLRRIHCPYCGNEDAESMEYLAANETPHERVYVCHKCTKYLTCLDTSELIEKPPTDLIPFELLHLDLIAQQKGFTPLAWRHWNTVTP